MVSGVVQLADASFRIMKLMDTIKEGGKDRRRLCDEITLLWMTLRNLEAQFAPLSSEQDGAWMKPIDSLAESDGLLDQLSAALNEVWCKLTTSDTKRGMIMQTLRWPLDQPYVDRIVTRIEHLKTSIIMVQGQASISLAQDVREQVSFVKKAADDIQFKEIIDWLSSCNFTQKQESIAAAPGRAVSSSRAINLRLGNQGTIAGCGAIVFQVQAKLSSRQALSTNFEDCTSPTRRWSWLRSVVLILEILNLLITLSPLFSNRLYKPA